MPLDSRLLSGRIEGAQKRIEANNFARRKHVLTYDDVMNQQRKLIYKERAEVLLGDDISDKIKNMIAESVKSSFDTYINTDNDFESFRSYYRGLITDSKNFKYTDEELESIDKEALLTELTERALAVYESKNELYAKIPEIRPDAMREMEKRILLSHVDRKWMDHLEAMDDIKEYVGLNSYAQRDPVAMYRLESSELFDDMIRQIKEDTVKDVLSHTPVVKIAKRTQIAKPTSAGFEGGAAPSGEKGPQPPRRSEETIPAPAEAARNIRNAAEQTTLKTNSKGFSKWD